MVAHDQNIFFVRLCYCRKLRAWAPFSSPFSYFFSGRRSGWTRVSSQVVWRKRFDRFRSYLQEFFAFFTDFAALSREMSLYVFLLQYLYFSNPFEKWYQIIHDASWHCKLMSKKLQIAIVRDPRRDLMTQQYLFVRT